MRKTFPIVRTVPALSLFIIILLTGCSSYQHQEYAKSVLISSESVAVIQSSDVIVFEPQSPYTVGVVFYPGGKVGFESYAPLLRELAENGMYCVLCRMPADFAFMDINKAKDVVAEKPQLTWYLAGHSLGGAMAAYYAAAHADELQGLILLAAYSTCNLSQTNLRVLTVYGSNDQVMNREHLEKYAGNLPATAQLVVIEGGNHAQFGDYGFQKGDGEAFIPTELQVLQTADAILQLMQ